MATPQNDVYSVASGPIYAGRFAPALTGNMPAEDAGMTGSTGGTVAPAFDGSYERSSFTPSGSSLTPGAGVGGSILAKINPKPATEDSNGFMWMNATVELVGMNGEQPTSQFLQAGIHNFGGVWPAGRCTMYSYDSGESWAYHSSPGVKDTGNNLIQWRHNAPYTQDRVRISESRSMSVHSHGTRIVALAAAYSFVEPAASSVAFTPTASVAGYAAQAFIAAEYAASTDVLGNTVPVQPFYTLQINDTSVMPVSGPKKIWHMQGGTHSGEDMADFSLWYLLNWLCGSSTEAIELRRNFRVLVYPMTTANGRAAGYGRGGTYSTRDPNRWIDQANSTPEVTAIRNANGLDFLGLPLKIFMDFHGSYSGKWEIFKGVDTGGADSTFRTKLQTITGFTVSDQGLTPSNRKNGWYPTAASDGFAGAKLSVTIEFGDPTPTSESDLVAFSQAIGTAVYQMNNEGVLA